MIDIILHKDTNSYSRLLLTQSFYQGRYYITYQSLRSTSSFSSGTPLNVGDYYKYLKKRKL